MWKKSGENVHASHRPNHRKGFKECECVGGWGWAKELVLLY